MTFSALRSAFGTIARRALEIGSALPVLESSSHEGNDGGDNTSSPAIAKPTGIVENDLLFAHITADDSGTLTPPSDTVSWIEITQGATPNSAVHVGLWYKFATAVTEPATYTWTNSSAQRWGLSVSRISGVDLAAPITNGGAGFSTSRLDGAAGGASDKDVVVEAILATRTNCLLLHAVSTDNNFGLNSLDPSSSDGEVNLFSDVHGGTSGIWHGTSHEDHAAGGGTGTRIWSIVDSFAGSEERITHLVGFQPPVA